MPSPALGTGECLCDWVRGEWAWAGRYWPVAHQPSETTQGIGLDKEEKILSMDIHFRFFFSFTSKLFALFLC